jgi:hypothetical protein
MIEGEFEAAEGAEAVGFSHSDVGFVVQTFDDAAGKQFLSAEIARRRFVRAVTSRRPDTINWPNADSSSFLFGAFWLCLFLRQKPR